MSGRAGYGRRCRCDFAPGLGALFVDRETPPAGPFPGYNREGNLSATIYMTPLDELENGTFYDNLRVVDHDVSRIDIYRNVGHPGVEARRHALGQRFTAAG